MGAAAESAYKSNSVAVVEVVDAPQRKTRSTANYAPLVTKSPFLLFICSLVILCIVGLQLALNHSVPIERRSSAPIVKRQKVQTTIINGTPVFFQSIMPPSDSDHEDGDFTFTYEVPPTTPPSTTSSLEFTEFPGPTTESPQPTGFPEPTTESPQPTGFPEPITESLEPTGFPGPTTESPQPTGFPEPTTESPQPTGFPEPTTESPEPTGFSEPTTEPSEPTESSKPAESTESTEVAGTTVTPGQPPPNSYITITDKPAHLTVTDSSDQSLTETSSIHTVGQPAPNSQITLTSVSNELVTLTPGQTVTDSNGTPVPTLAYIDGRLVTTNDNTASAGRPTALTVFSAGTPIATVTPGSAVSTLYSNDIPIATITPALASTSKDTEELMTFVSSSTESDGTVKTFVVVAPKPTQTDEVKGIFPTLQDGPIRRLQLDFDGYHYFFAMYSGTFIAVFFKILWTCVYGGSKMMEPFYQLNKPEGASAKESLMSDYLSSGISWWSLKVVFSGHWVMILTLVVALLITLLPPLAAESMSVRALDRCLLSDGLIHPCNPAWILNVNMIRVLQTALALIACCILIMVIVKLPRRSGINANPSSIATMATLLHHPDILSEIRSIGSNHTPDELAALLSHSRYQITCYIDAKGQEHISLAKANIRFDQPEDQDQDHDQDQDQDQHPHPSQYVQVANPNSSHLVPEHYRPPPNHTSTVLSSILIILVIGVFAVVLRYWFEHGPTPFNNFFNSDHFGPRFILTSASSLIAMIWLDIEREVRIHTPYRTLARRNAEAKFTILATVDGSAHQSLVVSLLRKHYFHFVVTLAAVLADFLTVAVAGVPYSSAQIRPAFVASTWTTVGILSFMFVAIVGVLFWRWSNHQLGIPRRPNETLLKVWMMLANEGNMIRKTVEDGWSVAKEKDRDEHVLKFDAKYWAGWTTDDQGRRRWCVDGEGGTQAVPEYEDDPSRRNQSQG